MAKASVAIAHGLSTFIHSNRLIVIDQGRVVEQGTHGELLGKQDIYQRLGNSQFQPVK